MRDDTTRASSHCVLVGLTVAAASLAMFMVTAAVASAYTAEITPEDNCYVGSRATAAAIEHSLQPADGAQEPAGTAVTFTASATIPVTFAIASTPTLSAPYLDSAAVTPDATGTVSFSSSSATATSGIVYWELSFSTSSLAECAGLPPRDVTTVVRALNVLPVAPSAPAPETPAPASGVTPVAYCTVPNLHGLSLPRARATLRRDDCRLGRVSHTKHAHGAALVVTKQSPSNGSKRGAGTVVNVTLGPKHRHR